MIIAGAAVHRARGRFEATVRRGAGHLAARAPGATELNVENVRAAAARLGVGVDLLPGGFMKLSQDGTVSYAFSSNFDFERLVPYFVCGDKRLTQTILQERAIPVPRFAVFGASSFGAAAAFVRELPGAAVTKPVRGTAGGAGITLGIRSRSELRGGFARARALGREVLVEEQVPGDNVRVTILDGRILGIVRRTPAHVIGDGAATVAALVERKNALWRSRRRENRLFRPIELDRHALRVLHRGGLAPDAIPVAGRVVPLREVSNADQGGEVDDVADVLHPAHSEIALAAASALGPALCGVDLIVADLRTAGGAYVNEVNTTPSLYVANAMVDGAPSTFAAECVLRHRFALPD